MKTRTAPAFDLPLWSRAVMACLPLRASRGEVEADFAELFVDRQSRYGRWYAHRRLSADIVSLWRGTPRGGHVLQDLRFGVRLFRKHPIPVGFAVAGLALAIGVVTAVFSLVNATMLRPFAMDAPQSVVQITRSRGPWSVSEWPYRRFLDMKVATAVSSVEASMPDKARLATAKDEAAPERKMLFVSGGYLRTLGGRAVVGRTLAPEDDQPGAPPVVVISYDLFVSDLQSDPGRVGSTLWLDGAPATIVGVLEKQFTGPVTDRISAWAPVGAFDDLSRVAESYIANGRTPASMTGAPFTPTSLTQVNVLARLAQGQSLSAAEENIAAIVHRAEIDADPKAKPTAVRLFSMASPIDGPRAAESYLEVASILAVVGLVLAVACANTANLLLAAAATRTREIGIRLALGATRRRLLAQMVTESLTLGLTAGVLGFLFALWLSPMLGRIVGIAPGTSLTPDGRVLAFAIGVALLCGLGAGIAPARFGGRGHLLAALQSQGGAAGRSAVPSRLRTSFIGFQAAVSLVLLVAAALFARMAFHMTRVDLGFDVDRVLTASVTTPETDPKTASKTGFDELAYFRRAAEDVRAIPSVESVGMIEIRPFGGTREVVGNRDSESEGYTLFINRTNAGYFSAAGIRLKDGRFFTEEENAGGAPVALISESVARRFFQGNPIGQSLATVAIGESGLADEDKSATIIGVVSEAMLNRVYTEEFGAIHRPMRQGQGPNAQITLNPPTLIVRARNPRAAAREVEEALRRADPRVRPSTWIVQDDISRMLDDKRMLAWLAGPMAAMALVLAALGIYGVSSFVTSRRTQEVSVRMAMGASAMDVLKLLMRDGLRPVLIGLTVGLAIAIVAGRVFASLFVGVSPNDPIAIGVSVVTLLGAALVAVLIPARRAARVDPASVLRES